MKKSYKYNNIVIYYRDNIKLMKQYPDNYFELAIVDPPYGVRIDDKANSSGRFSPKDLDVKHKLKAMSDWNTVPPPEYYKELFRVSQFQIIWGANNFNEHLPSSNYFIIWDKKQPVPRLAEAEYAWTNIKIPAKIFRYSIHKMLSDRKKEGKRHLTQKPIALYVWILKKYAQKDWKILDTHLGSGTIMEACNQLGFSLVACENDKAIYLNAKDLLKRMEKRPTLFQLNN